jgi:hypothetical protein
MGNFDSFGFLQQGLNRFTPQGGFGIPNLGVLQALLQRQSASALRGTVASDQERLMRAGLGRSVAGAFSPGTRSLQFNRDLMERMQELFAQNAQMAQSQRNQLLGLLAGGPLQIAYQEANKPSFLSSLLGNVLGTGANLFGPGLAMKALGNPELDYIKALLGGGTAEYK